MLRLYLFIIVASVIIFQFSLIPETFAQKSKLNQHAYQVQAEKSPKWLFVLRAKYGKFEKSRGGEYCLELSGLDENILAYVNYPKSKTIFLYTEKFLKKWDHLVKQKETKKELEHAEINVVFHGQIQSISMELISPKCLSNGSWKIKVRFLDKSVITGKVIKKIELFINSDKDLYIDDLISQDALLTRKPHCTECLGKYSVAYKNIDINSGLV